MRASGVPDEGIALLLFGEKLDERIEKRLDRAEKSLPRNPRDRRTRQAFGNAFRKVREAESEEAQQIALVGAAEAILGVLEAEPGEHRDWLPEHIRNDPARAIAIEIARAKSEFAAQGEQASRPRASQLEGVKDRRRRGQLEALGHS